ncbi:hypothetical protein N7481_008764 [Penicillium waksmanii]|uniref:uncharacterized protein n=1 Tax=Penicillium waksmanii TaxID=69791 RepID=UPI0025490474|nr:uncharacterized protein N7481_008764 [Penicillium waksmanii]KAJ5975057.1 hypothetical protein N7481_008764 [Penicillium waksmanii]
MPASEFRAHRQEASQPGRYAHLRDVKSGDLDYSISFILNLPGDEKSEIEFLLVVSDAHDYPDSHSFLASISSHETTDQVTSLIQKCQDPHRFSRLSIHDALMTIDSLLSPASQSTSHGVDATSEEDTPDSEGLNEFDDSFNFDDGYEWVSCPQSASLLHEIRNHDLRTASAEGFQVGYIEDTMGKSIISVSCQIAQLDISNDALQVWGIDRSETLILLIRYPRSYQSLQEILQTHEISLSGIEMRVGLCEYSFTSPHVAKDIFKCDKMPRNEKDLSSDLDRQPGLRDLFISYSLHHVLNERFLAIAKLRRDFNLSWTGAELFCHEMQGKTIDATGPEEKYWAADEWLTPVPHLMESDHFADAGMKVEFMSLPLLAMQYTLRHFVRCPEFCLVCHCKTGDGFESLKPYVCSRGLCLFQYLELGLGASIECEVRSKPMVVDLLVSLAYASAISGHLESFPDGLRLKVPLKNSYGFDQNGEIQNPDFTSRALLDPVTMILSGSGVEKIDSGDWIMIRDAEPVKPTVTWHCQVKRIPRKAGEVILSDPVKIINQITSPPPIATQSWVPPYSHVRKHPVKFTCYDQAFEVLSPQDKRGAIKLLLDTLPSINQIANLLGESSTRGLRSCLEGKVSPAAFDLLRWIIASNRSYIVHETGKSAHRHEQMTKHPYKLTQETSSPRRFPHGTEAPLYNWHGILREGLHFRKIAHGRASGNGVYLSENFATSLAFSTRGTGGRNWPHSVLDMQYVISLNEIVNCPDKFVCKMPHYVVQFIDWIQPRYLLVGGKVSPSQPVTPFGVSPPKGPKTKRPVSKTGITDLTDDDDDGPNQTKAKIQSREEAPQSIPSNPGVILSSDSLLSAIMDANHADEEGEMTDRVSKKARKYSAGQLDAIWNSLDSEDGGLLLP